MKTGGRSTNRYRYKVRGEPGGIRGSWAARIADSNGKYFEERVRLLQLHSFEVGPADLLGRGLGGVGRGGRFAGACIVRC